MYSSTFDLPEYIFTFIAYTQRMHTKTPLCHSTELVECIAITLIKYIHARPLHTIGLANELYNFNQFVKIGLLLSELHVQDA